jgi:hypothetical protein
MIVHGVDITSRYDAVEELELMKRVIEALPEDIRDQIESINCDSQCGACYAVELRRWKAREVEAISRYVDAALIIFDDGYNLLFLRCGEDDLQVGMGEWPLFFPELERLDALPDVEGDGDTPFDDAPRGCAQ